MLSAIEPEAAPFAVVTPLTATVAVVSLKVGVTVIVFIALPTLSVYDKVVVEKFGASVPALTVKSTRPALADSARVMVIV